MASFRATGAELGTLHASFFLIYAIMQIPTGVLVDRVGPRRTAAIGTGVMNIGALWFTLAGSYPAALGARFLIGLGGSVIFVSMLRFAASWFTPTEFTTINGVSFAVAGVGGILATTPFAIAVDLTGWHRTIQVLALLGLGTAIAIAAFVRDTPQAAGFDRISGSRSTESLTIAEIGGSLRRVLSDPWVWAVSVILFGVGGINLTLFGLWGIPFVVQVYGTSVQFASLFTLLGGVGLVIGPPTIGWIAGRTGRRTSIIVTGAVLYTICHATIAILGDPPLIIVGLSFGLVGVLLGAFVVSYPLIKERHPTRVAGIALGSINGSSFLGAAILPTVMGAILDTYWTGETLQGARVYSEMGYRVTFALATSISILALLCAIGLHWAATREDSKASEQLS